jgi:hypothetical protein
MIFFILSLIMFFGAFVTDHHIEVVVMEAGQDTSVASVVLWQIHDRA